MNSNKETNELVSHHQVFSHHSRHTHYRRDVRAAVGTRLCKEKHRHKRGRVSYTSGSADGPCTCHSIEQYYDHHGNYFCSHAEMAHLLFFTRCVPELVIGI